VKTNPILIEKSKVKTLISIEKCKPEAVKIEVGRKNKLIIIDKAKSNHLMYIDVNVNVVIEKREKKIPEEEKPVEQAPKPVLNFVFEKPKSKQIEVIISKR
jgi:hypothetical protein